MKAVDEVPLWDSVASPVAQALELAFGCHHGKLSRVFTIRGRSYKVCCECGARFRYSLRTMSIVRPRPRILRALRHLRFRHSRMA